MAQGTREHQCSAAPGTLRLIAVMGYRCERCEHEWVPRMRDRAPMVCPTCKSPYWDRPRRTKAAVPP